MLDLPAIRRLALELPETEDASSARALSFQVAGRGMAWTYMERVVPKKPRVPRLDLLAIRCRLEKKEMLIEAAPDRFFDDDHYRGYPAVLVRLEAVGEDELRGLFTDAWSLVAPKALVKRRGGQTPE